MAVRIKRLTEAFNHDYEPILFDYNAQATHSGPGDEVPVNDAAAEKVARQRLPSSIRTPDHAAKWTLRLVSNHSSAHAQARVTVHLPVVSGDRS